MNRVVRDKTMEASKVRKKHESNVEQEKRNQKRGKQIDGKWDEEQVFQIRDDGERRERNMEQK